jgi:hypothetical protein
VIKGSYVAGTAYSANYIQRDCVKYTDNIWYAAHPTVGTTSTTWVPAEWEKLNSFKNVATDTLLAEEANIAGFIYQDEKMISQTGTINGDVSTNWAHEDFVPNIILDGVNGTAKIQGSLYASDGKFKALDDGTLELEFETEIERYGSSGNIETVLQTIIINNTTGLIETKTSDNDSAYMKSQGIFANKAGIQALHSSSGVELKASIVGLGQGDLAASSYGGLGAICGVYGSAFNENVNPAPFYGGYFRKLKASGLYLTVKATTESYECTDYVVYVSCYNTKSITVTLPSNPYEGKFVQVRRNNPSIVTIDGGDESILLPSGSVVESYAMEARGLLCSLLFDGSYWLLNI